MLVEAFPAAQLRTWGLPYTRYGPPAKKEDRTPTELAARRARRKSILAGVVERTRVEVPKAFSERMIESTDALDAFIAAFAGRAAANRDWKLSPRRPMCELEGCIAVHK
jgi:hypothetical protein